ncbi:hypothetical protein [Reichenbachiella versicolor]|uniref:hypothetical protein n=1 Tax=Reichenbachiella versicolor TaxID=1821036 RepID=UPI000D6DD8BC|nr:hypothetical protein [Reichenbachiella versicolor]
MISFLDIKVEISSQNQITFFFEIFRQFKNMNCPRRSAATKTAVVFVASRSGKENDGHFSSLSRPQEK